MKKSAGASEFLLALHRALAPIGAQILNAEVQRRLTKNQLQAWSYSLRLIADSIDEFVKQKS